MCLSNGLAQRRAADAADRSLTQERVHSDGLDAGADCLSGQGELGGKYVCGIEKIQFDQHLPFSRLKSLPFVSSGLAVFASPAPCA